jgi:hypothetical protein
MDNAEIIARLEEVVKTLEREQRRYALSGSYWVRAKDGRESHRAPEIADKRIADAYAKYSDVVARIAAVRLAIERLPQ